MNHMPLITSELFWQILGWWELLYFQKLHLKWLILMVIKLSKLYHTSLLRDATTHCLFSILVAKRLMSKAITNAQFMMLSFRFLIKPELLLIVLVPQKMMFFFLTMRFLKKSRIKILMVTASITSINFSNWLIQRTFLELKRHMEVLFQRNQLLMF